MQSLFFDVLKKIHKLGIIIEGPLTPFDLD